MNEPKQDPVPLAWIHLQLFPKDYFENSVFGDEDQLLQLFAASFDKYPFLIEITERAKNVIQDKKDPNKN